MHHGNSDLPTHEENQSGRTEASLPDIGRQNYANTPGESVAGAHQQEQINPKGKNVLNEATQKPSRMAERGQATIQSRIDSFVDDLTIPVPDHFVENNRTARYITSDMLKSRFRGHLRKVLTYEREFDSLNSSSVWINHIIQVESTKILIKRLESKMERPITAEESAEISTSTSEAGRSIAYEGMKKQREELQVNYKDKLDRLEGSIRNAITDHDRKNAAGNQPESPWNRQRRKLESLLQERKKVYEDNYPDRDSLETRERFHWNEIFPDEAVDLTKPAYPEDFDNFEDFQSYDVYKTKYKEAHLKAIREFKETLKSTIKDLASAEKALDNLRMQEDSSDTLQIPQELRMYWAKNRRDQALESVRNVQSHQAFKDLKETLDSDLRSITNGNFSIGDLEEQSHITINRELFGNNGPSTIQEKEKYRQIISISAILMILNQHISSLYSFTIYRGEAYKISDKSGKRDSSLR